MQGACRDHENRFGSLSLLLRSRGYPNISVCGGELDFDNLQRMLVHQRFGQMVGMADMSDCKYRSPSRKTNARPPQTMRFR